MVVSVVLTSTNLDFIGFLKKLFLFKKKINRESQVNQISSSSLNSMILKEKSKKK